MNFWHHTQTWVVLVGLAAIGLRPALTCMVVQGIGVSATGSVHLPAFHLIPDVIMKPAFVHLQ